jgi:type IV pilus assembly protein PilN
MIRINLLATERKAQKKRAAAPPGALQLYLFLGLFVGGAVLACAGLWWFKSRQIADLDSRIATATAEQTRLQQVKQKVEEFERKKKLLADKMALIERLKAEQASAVHMLDEISKALPDFVWLQNMDQTGAVVKFTGQSNSLASVADFMTNLQKTGWFPKVDLDNTQEQNNIVTFSLTAAFQNPEALKAAAAAAASPAPGAPKS